MNTAELANLSVLYAEDEEEMREQVAHFLRKKIAIVWLAKNGCEALKLYDQHQPDIVISDIMMPEMDGLELAETIKLRNANTPVILMTAFNDSSYLHRAIDIGVDNYVLKPINLHKLHIAMLKSADLLLKTRALEISHAQLEAYHQAAEEERALVSDLMNRMMQPELMLDVQVQFWLKATDRVSGDLVAFRRTRNQRLYMMLADSTGHGLPAALNLLPINHIFYSMVDKGFPISQIVEEMNWTLKKQSPEDRFVAAFVACIDNYNCVIESWNGGIPAGFVINKRGEIYHRFTPNNLPLGILDNTFTAQTEVFQWKSASQMVLFSDGVLEAENEDGIAWGDKNICQVASEFAPEQRFSQLSESLYKHLGTRHAFDDMTLMVIDCPMDES